MAARTLTDEEQKRFDLVPKAVTTKAKVVPVSFVPPGFVGITVGNRIMLRKGHEQKEQLIAHELVHVRQFQELGIPRFFARYLTEYAKGIVKLRKLHPAYRAISFEVEAREEASRWAKRVGTLDDDHERHRD
ncbi:hypothetical protein B7486_61850 [cyanobacterium TDX16]|nr:hypothetical protein B7486_61850 [cyanobacterium TDX16]